MNGDIIHPNGKYGLDEYNPLKLDTPEIGIRDLVTARLLNMLNTIYSIWCSTCELSVSR